VKLKKSEMLSSVKVVFFASLEEGFFWVLLFSGMQCLASRVFAITLF